MMAGYGASKKVPVLRNHHLKNSTVQSLISPESSEIYFLFVPISGRKTVNTPISGKKAQTW